MNKNMNTFYFANEGMDMVMSYKKMSYNKSD